MWLANGSAEGGAECKLGQPAFAGAMVVDVGCALSQELFAFSPVAGDTLALSVRRFSLKPVALSHRKYVK